MRRRSHVGLVLAGALPLMLTGCGDSTPDTYTLSKSMTFSSVQQCSQTGFPTEACAGAFIKAKSDYDRITPEYDSQQDCENDFVAGYCDARTEDDKQIWRPRMNGFKLDVEGSLTEEQVTQAKKEIAATGHANDNQMLEGILLGYLLKSAMQGSLLYGPAQPTYLVKEPYAQQPSNTGSSSGYSSGSSFSSSGSSNRVRAVTLSEQLDQGQSYLQSRQSHRYGGSYYSRSSTLGQSLRHTSSSSGSGGSGLSRHSASSSVSRGGFGSHASARGGWGGHSSSSHGS